MTHKGVHVDGIVYLCSCMQQGAKLSAAKDKMDQMMTALKKDFHSTLDKKDAEVCALEEEIRGFQCVVDQPGVLQLSMIGSGIEMCLYNYA